MADLKFKYNLQDPESAYDRTREVFGVVYPLFPATGDDDVLTQHCSLVTVGVGGVPQAVADGVNEMTDDRLLTEDDILEVNSLSGNNFPLPGMELFSRVLVKNLGAAFTYMSPTTGFAFGSGATTSTTTTLGEGRFAYNWGASVYVPTSLASNNATTIYCTSF